MPGRRSPGAAGFTLVEVVVVLALLAAIAAMAVPFLAKSIPRTALRAAAAELRAALGAARSDAIAAGRTVVFRADHQAGYWIGERYHPLKTAGDVAAEQRVAVAGNGQISFFSWGGSSGGRVWIEDSAGRRELAVDAATGRAFEQP